jgi:hypothetical protein
MSRTLHFALAPLGVGGPGSDGLWKDARVAKNSSVDIDDTLRGNLGLPFPVNRYTHERTLVTVKGQSRCIPERTRPGHETFRI